MGLSGTDEEGESAICHGFVALDCELKGCPSMVSFVDVGWACETQRSSGGHENWSKQGRKGVWRPSHTASRLQLSMYFNSKLNLKLVCRGCVPYGAEAGCLLSSSGDPATAWC
jgi:hypothetical protein